MPEKHQPTDLSRLSQIAKAINERSNFINQRLLLFEKQLGEMNLGVSVWLESSPLQSTSYDRRAQHSHGREFKGGQFERQILLGFDRTLNGQYRLLLKDVYKDDPLYSENETELKVLLEAPRELRIKSLQYLNALVELLEREAQKVLRGIEKGLKEVEEVETA